MDWKGSHGWEVLLQGSLREPNINFLRILFLQHAYCGLTKQVDRDNIFSNYRIKNIKVHHTPNPWEVALPVSGQLSTPSLFVADETIVWFPRLTSFINQQVLIRKGLEVVLISLTFSSVFLHLLGVLGFSIGDWGTLATVLVADGCRAPCESKTLLFRGKAKLTRHFPVSIPISFFSTNAGVI